MTISRWSTIVLFSVMACGGASTTSAAVTTPTTPSTPTDIPCPDGTGATFAWWVGKWGYSVPGYDPGNSVVTSASSGCALDEQFVDIHGQKQHTTIQFDATTKVWKRVVVDPFRTYASTGTFAADGSIAFYETPSDRESYHPTDKDHVHFIGENSTDGGKTWKVQFDATYARTP